MLMVKLKEGITLLLFEDDMRDGEAMEHVAQRGCGPWKCSRPGWIGSGKCGLVDWN